MDENNTYGGTLNVHSLVVNDDDTMSIDFDFDDEFYKYACVQRKKESLTDDEVRVFVTELVSYHLLSEYNKLQNKKA